MEAILVVLAVLLFALWVGDDVYRRLIVPAAPLNFDEAAHSLPGFYILRDVRNLDLRALWGDTHIQTLWPPGFSYLQAPFLAILGRSDEAARLFAYIMLVLTVLMAYPIAREIRPDLAPLATWISALFTFSAPGWLFVSSWAMQETPVAFVLFGVFWLYLRAHNTGRLGWYVATSVGFFFLFLTKYNYAAFAVAAVGLVDGVMRVRNMISFPVGQGDPPLTPPKGRGILFSLLRQLLSPEFVLLYLPFGLGLAFWFLGGTDIVPTAVKWRDFRFFVTNEDSGYTFWSAQNLLFYVRVAAEWLMPHWSVLLLAVGLVALAVLRIRRAGVLLLAVFFGLGFVLATVHQLKAERYITPLFPSLWLLAGLGGAFGMDRLTTALSSQASIVKTVWDFRAVGITLLFIYTLYAQTLPRLQPVWAGESAHGLRAAAVQIVRWQDPARDTLIIGTFGELSPPLFEWRLRPLPAYAGDQPHGEIQYDAPPGEGNDLQRVATWTKQNPGTQITLIQVDVSAALYNTNDMRNKNAGRQTLAAEVEANLVSLGERGYRLADQEMLPGGIKISYYLPN